jgi:MFS family permease
MNKPYRRTTAACYIGITVSAILNNTAAILFVPLMGLYGLRYVDLGILVGVNFAVQMLVALTVSGRVDKTGYKPLLLRASLAAILGLLLFAMTPLFFRGREFWGFLLASVIFAIAGGLYEILLSPIIDGTPASNKGAAMSLMHSMFSWGHVAFVALTTLALLAFGAESWQLLVMAWILVPLACLILSMKAPLPETKPAQKTGERLKTMFSAFGAVALLAIFFGGGAELVMSQWSSTYFVQVLGLPKATGDLLGLCGFAAMMGLGRMLYGIWGAKIPVRATLIFGGFLAAGCYITVALSSSGVVGLIACALCGLAVSQFWPGTLIAASARFPLAGAWLFGYLAASGIIGASFGPWLTGVIVEHNVGAVAVASLLNIPIEEAALRAGLLFGAVLSLGVAACHYLLRVKGNTKM